MTVGHSAYFIGPDQDPDRYRLLHRVNHGGEAELWNAAVTLGDHPEPVAVKLLKPEHADAIDEWKVRWDEQVTLLRLIDSPGVVRVHDSFECDGPHRREEAPARKGRNLCLVMTWIAGQNLWEWVPQHATLEARPQALMHLGQVAAVLDELHSGAAIESRRPVSHGDLSPGNVIINADGQAVLVDFGLFRMARQPDSTSRGTEGYVAPEVIARGTYGPEADRYAFGALTYFVLSGGQPPPAEPAALEQALMMLSGIDARPQLRQHLALMAAEDPTRRPPAGEWIKVLRQQASTALRSAGTGLPPEAPRGLSSLQVPATGPLAWFGAHPRVSLVLALVTVAIVVVGTLLLNGIGDNTTSGSPPAEQSPTTRTVTSTVTETASADTSETSVSVPESEQPEVAPPGTEETSLASLNPVKVSLGDLYIDEFPVVGPAEVNAKPYEDAVTFADLPDSCDGWADYNLGYRFSSFTSEIGLLDTSSSGVDVTFRVIVNESDVLDQTTVRAGQTGKLSASGLSEHFRLRLDVTSEMPNDGSFDCGTPVFANAILRSAT